MFETVPELAFPFPKALVALGAQHWLAFRLTYSHPWFVATFLVGSGDAARHATWGVSSDRDLVDRLEHADGKTLVGLVCIVPPWSSATGRWSSREVGSIWRVREPIDRAEGLVFQDLDGADFVAGLHSAGVLDFGGRQLIMKIAMRSPLQAMAAGTHTNDRRSQAHT
ncbi:hypothetical protein [Rhodoferax sp. OV413]|uniref:hypothetical protein n=1 Tax=Rhodoferax sp. OV413 TaxID=1855285 RepID=UPI000B842177|nr:hypothetical protein [Rhodoferax sp. OV413]